MICFLKHIISNVLLCWNKAELSTEKERDMNFISLFCLYLLWGLFEKKRDNQSLTMQDKILQKVLLNCIVIQEERPCWSLQSNKTFSNLLSSKIMSPAYKQIRRCIIVKEVLDCTSLHLTIEGMTVIKSIIFLVVWIYTLHNPVIWGIIFFPWLIASIGRYENKKVLRKKFVFTSRRWYA